MSESCPLPPQVGDYLSLLVLLKGQGRGSLFLFPYISGSDRFWLAFPNFLLWNALLRGFFSHGVRGSHASSLLVCPLRVHDGDLSLGSPFGSTRSSWSLWATILFNLHVMLLQCLEGRLILASSGVEALSTRDIVFYRPRMRVGKGFTPVCLPVYLSDNF